MGVNDDWDIEEETNLTDDKYICLEKLVSKTILWVFVKNSDGDPLKRWIVTR